MHRNTLLLVSFLAVIVALLVGFNIGRTLPQSSSQTASASPTPLATTTPTLTYLSGSACGVSYQYPNSMQALESSGSGTVLAHKTKPEESVVVVCQAEIPRVPLTPDKIDTISLQMASGSATISARLYHDTSPNNDTPVDKLIFTHPKTGLDVFIAGFGTTFNQLITTIRLL